MAPSIASFFVLIMIIYCLALDTSDSEVDAASIFRVVAIRVRMWSGNMADGRYSEIELG